MTPKLEIVAFLDEIAGLGPAQALMQFLASNSRWLEVEQQDEVGAYLKARPELSALEDRVAAVRRVSQALGLAVEVTSFSDLAKAALEARWLLVREFRTFAAVLNTSPSRYLGRLSGYLTARSEADARVSSVKDVLPRLYTLLLECPGQDVPGCPSYTLPPKAGAPSNNLCVLLREAGDYDPTAWMALAFFCVCIGEMSSPWPKKLRRALDPDTIQYSAAVAEMSAVLADDSNAAGQLECCELLETLAYNWHQATKASTEKTCRAFRVRSSGYAQMWFMQECPPRSLWQDLLPQDASIYDMGTAATMLAQRAARFYSKQMAQNEENETWMQATFASREQYLFRSIAAFCHIVSILGKTPHHVHAACVEFRKLIDGPWWEHLDVAAQACFVLRYGTLIHRNKDLLNDPAPSFRWTVDRLGKLLESIDPIECPGLLRDGHLLRARLLRELAVWAPGTAVEAVETFRRALSIPWARHDREARGLGLSDLAGALLYAGGAAPEIEREADGFYRLALAYLPAEDFHVSRANVLLNYAIFLNERASGFRSHNQEKALKILEEGIGICENRGVGTSDGPDTAHARSVLASSWNTHGNILRSRRLGNPTKGGAAIEQAMGLAPGNLDLVTITVLGSYRQGLRVLDRGGGLALSGLLHLNCGYALMEDSHTDSNLTSAMEEIQTAIALLKGAPVLRALAEVAHAEVWVLSHGPSCVARTISERLASVRAAEAVLTQYADHEGKGKAAMREAELCLLADSDSQLVRAIRALERASEAFEKAHVWHLFRQARILFARLSVRRAISEVKEATRRDMLRQAERGLQEAFDSLSDSDISYPVLARLERGARRAAVASDLVWVRHRLGSTFSDIQPLLEICASFDGACGFGSIPNMSWGPIAADALIAERSLWESSPRVSIEAHLADEVRRLEDALQSTAEARARRLLRQEPMPHSDLGPPDGVVEVQFITSLWGGIAILRGHEKGVSPIIVETGIDRPTVQRWLYGSSGAHSHPGWVSSAQVGGMNHLGWDALCNEVVAEIGTKLWRHVIDEIPGDLAETDIVVVPGVLAPFPIHAAEVDGAPLITRVRGFALSGRLGSASNATHSSPVRSALYVIANPDCSHMGLPPLLEPAKEVAALSQLTVDAGREVKIYAASGRLVGGAVFADVGCQVPDQAEIASGHPTPRSITEELSRHDLICFAGHGQGQTASGGRLLLTDESGLLDYLDLFRLLAAGPFPPSTGAILSGCETAWEVHAPVSGMVSVSSSFLRLGADYVLGSLWWVADTHAPVVSTNFLAHLLRGEPCCRSYVQAVRALIGKGVPVSRWGAYCLWLGVA